jgi:orotate phosphoribosyltransferase
MSPSASSSLHDELIALIRTHSLRRGRFTLASGAQSDYYIDARLTTMRPEGLRVIGKLALQQFDHLAWQPDAVGGLTLGADPIAYAIAHASAGTARPIRGFTVRKEPKGHGTQRLIEGPLEPGDRVVVVEDVLTTGQSAIRAVEAVRAAGHDVIGVLAIVDREEGGVANLQALGVQAHALAPVSELLRS